MLSNTYKPINCDLHSHIEDHIVKKNRVNMYYLDENGNKKNMTTILVDVWTENGKEFLRADSNLSLRLDQITRINDLDFTAASCQIK